MLKISILFTFLMCLSVSIIAQIDSDTSTQNKDTIQEFYNEVKMAQYPGGEAKMYAYINKNLKYPPTAFENDIQGKIIVQFVVRKDGSISNVETLGARIGWGLEEEAIRVIKNMPNWEPAEKNGANVAVRFRIPIKFYISDGKKKKNSKPKKKTSSKPEAFD